MMLITVLMLMPIPFGYRYVQCHPRTSRVWAEARFDAGTDEDSNNDLKDFQEVTGQKLCRERLLCRCSLHLLIIRCLAAVDCDPGLSGVFRLCTFLATFSFLVQNFLFSVILLTSDLLYCIIFS